MPSSRGGSVGVARRRPGVAVRVRRGGLQVGEVQRARMLSAAVAILAEQGYERMSVARVSHRARVSRRTFYDVFEGREDCFLAAFEEALERVEGLVVGAYMDERGSWREKVRAGLGVFLGFLDEDPRMRSLLIVEALNVGPRALECRAQVLQGLGDAIGRDCSRSSGLPVLTGEAVVGAVFGVIHARVLAKDSGAMLGLLNELMGVIVLSYEGPAAARREIERRGSRTVSSGRKSPGRFAVKDPLDGLDMRLTYRTLRVLTVIGEQSGAGGLSNREVAEGAGVADQGQISKLLQRLEGLGLVENATPVRHRRDQPTGGPNAWRLTSRGQTVQRATRVDSAEIQENGVAS